MVRLRRRHEHTWHPVGSEKTLRGGRENFDMAYSHGAAVSPGAYRHYIVRACGCGEVEWQRYEPRYESW